MIAYNSTDTIQRIIKYALQRILFKIIQLKCFDTSRVKLHDLEKFTQRSIAGHVRGSPKAVPGITVNTLGIKVCRGEGAGGPLGPGLGDGGAICAAATARQLPLLSAWPRDAFRF